MILLAGARHDPQVRRVAKALRGRGAACRILDAPAFPETTRLELGGAGMRLNGKPLPRPDAVYLRALGWHPLSPAFARDLAGRPRGLVAQCDETRALLESLVAEWERAGVPVVNTLEANEQHSRKPLQLRRLEDAGVPVPPWLATNDAAAVRRFVRGAGRTVYKPLAGGALVQPVTPDDLADERLAALALAPVLFQQFVEGAPLRVFVVGNRAAAAAEIQSDALDYRANEQAVVATRLTPDERRIALCAARACGMPFAGVDLIRGPAGPVVLEANPSPMFAVFEDKTGCDVAGPLAGLLMQQT